jgi:hypothetical protein
VTRHDISPAELRQRILARDPDWYTTAQTTLLALPANPTSKQWVSLWGNIKRVYIDLQGSKCIYCETLIEGDISNDVEHFRPKAKVVPWKPPKAFRTVKLDITSPVTPKGDPGYRNLAYHPWNYAASCKHCNSVLKKNYFPICGTRRSNATNPRTMKGEKALFIYPIGDGDEDPCELIRFVGMHPEPLRPSGTPGYCRALVTIEVFKLNNAEERKQLFQARALLLGELYAWLRQEQCATTATDRRAARQWIAILLDSKAPHSSCLNSFNKLYEQDQVRARRLINEARDFLKSASRPGSA